MFWRSVNRLKFTIFHKKSLILLDRIKNSIWGYSTYQVEEDDLQDEFNYLQKNSYIKVSEDHMTEKLTAVTLLPKGDAVALTKHEKNNFKKKVIQFSVKSLTVVVVPLLITLLGVWVAYKLGDTK